MIDPSCEKDSLRTNPQPSLPSTLLKTAVPAHSSKRDTVAAPLSWWKSKKEAGDTTNTHKLGFSASITTVGGLFLLTATLQL